MIHKCECGEFLDLITISDGPTGSYVWLKNLSGGTSEQADMYACTSADCKHVGVVKCIPIEAKED